MMRVSTKNVTNDSMRYEAEKESLETIVERSLWYLFRGNYNPKSSQKFGKNDQSHLRKTTEGKLRTRMKEWLKKVWSFCLIWNLVETKNTERRFSYGSVHLWYAPDYYKSQIHTAM